MPPAQRPQAGRGLEDARTLGGVRPTRDLGEDDLSDLRPEGVFLRDGSPDLFFQVVKDVTQVASVVPLLDVKDPVERFLKRPLELAGVDHRRVRQGAGLCHGGS